MMKKEHSRSDASLVSGTLVPVDPMHTSVQNSSTTINENECKEKKIKSLLKVYKRLELEMNRFSSKNDGITKTNILRKFLLPYLRSDDKNFEQTGDKKVNKSLTNVKVDILSKWWESLLMQITPKAGQKNLISSTDKNAYLESISRILACKEWHDDNESMKAYEKQLTATLEYCIEKLQTLKNLPISMSAFVGKVFAYSFFYLSGVSTALLFLLNVKQSVVDSITPIFKDLSVDGNIKARLYEVFPKRVHHFIAFRGIQGLSPRQKLYINSIPVPTHPVRGIKDPNGMWVQRWQCPDSDVFNSFMRHIVIITEGYLSLIPNADKALLYNCPGYNIMLAHLYQIIQSSMNRILSNNMCKFQSSSLQDAMISSQRQQRNLRPESWSSVKSPINNGAMVIQRNELYYNTLIKVFRTLRDISYSSSMLSGNTISFVDRLFIAIARKISVHDHQRSGLLLGILYEFICHVDMVDWKFWLQCLYLMLNKTDHIQILLRSFSFLFNIWDKIPETMCIKYEEDKDKGWILKSGDSYKSNFMRWLVSDEMWERFFIHWHPFVRSYYLRLLVWRIIGIFYSSSFYIDNSRKLEANIQQCYTVFVNFVRDLNEKMKFKPDSPLSNKKLSIIPINSNDDFLFFEDKDISSAFSRTNEMKKTYPYEVFDEAIYSCTSLPGSLSSNREPRLQGKSENNSLVSSLGKFFKFLSTDNTANGRNSQDELFKEQKKSISTVSLSTMSDKSTYSSHSGFSLHSIPTSCTNFSIQSATSSELEFDFTDGYDPSTQPPELLTIPPTIIRPYAKFGLTTDTLACREKAKLMSSGKGENSSDENQEYLPHVPKVPCISMFINSKPFDRLFFSNNAPASDGLVGVIGASLFSNLDRSPANFIKWINLGKSLNEWNLIVEEFEDYLVRKVCADQGIFNNDPPSGPSSLNEEIVETDYLKRAIPFLPAEGPNERKLFNAG